MKLVLVLLLTTICCGCSAVVSTEPLGHRIHINPKDWEGTWTTLDPDVDDFRVKIRVIDTDSGQLRVEADTTGTAFVRAYGDWIFVSCPDDADSDYGWFVVALSKGVMAIWLPDAQKIGQLVDEGRLPGERDNGNVRLYPLTDADYEVMTSEQYGVLLHWKDPAILRRVSPTVSSAVTP